MVRALPCHRELGTRAPPPGTRSPMNDTPEPPVTPDSPREKSAGDDDVIRIEDLAPPSDVKGGRKILLGEVLTPPVGSRNIPES